MCMLPQLGGGGVFALALGVGLSGSYLFSRCKNRDTKWECPASAGQPGAAITIWSWCYIVFAVQKPIAYTDLLGSRLFNVVLLFGY